MIMSAVAERSAANSSENQPGADFRGETGLGAVAMSTVHDLRSPLAAIHSGAEMLKGPQLPEHQVRRLARNIYDASVRIQELLQDYVEVCRTREGRPNPTNLRSLVADAVARIAAAAAAQSVFVVQDVPADLAVTVDHRGIGSVLANLLANALEAMRAGGSIDISATVCESSVVIRVADTGPGIAPEIRDRLFQPLVTARKPNGWGLGLAQARRIVADHGGEMWLETPSGRGACIAFSLPAS
jgi:signal transduction histidine kinase